MGRLASGRFREEMLRRVERGLRDTAYEIERNAKGRAPVGATGSARNAYAKGAPGTLRRSIMAKQSGKFSWEIGVHNGPAMAYARMRDLGGVIVPKRARRLFWIGPDGRGHTAMRVEQTGNRYLTASFEEGVRRLKGNIRRTRSL